MTRYAVALGSNLGQRVEHLRAAVRSLSLDGRIDGVSGLYETAPVGGPEQDPYLNAVLTLESDLEPGALLVRLQEIEDQEGRERLVRWGPRPLDLDIVSSDGPFVNGPDLTVPHRRAAQRRFVLEPLSDIWPEALVARGKSAAEGLETVADQTVDLLARSWADPDAAPAGRYWVGFQLAWFLAIGLALALGGSLPDGDLGSFRMVGGGIAVAGGLLAVLSVRRLGPSLTVVPEPLPDATLVVTGPFARARHPIYGGVTLFVLGISMVVASASGVLLCLGLGVFFWFKTVYEERQLRIAYPGYSAYRRRVTRRLIPFLI
jgi:2-amino-4-hydroxy-6-hydroxymethyldihydropteridine diphosphokinase